MNRFFIACLLLIAVCAFAPASAFVDRNDVTSAAQFKDHVPASYLAKAGVTDDMTVDRALDAYITYALSFSSPTAYAYISQLTEPDAVKIHAGGSTAPASRGDVVAEGWNIEVGEGARVVIRYPGGVSHTITGPYTYTVPAYGEWGATGTFDKTSGNPMATTPSTTGDAARAAWFDKMGVSDDPIGWFYLLLKRHYQTTFCENILRGMFSDALCHDLPRGS